MLLYAVPFNGKDKKEMIQSINNTNIKDRLAGVPSSHKIFKDLIPKMLNLDPK